MHSIHTKKVYKHTSKFFNLCAHTAHFLSRPNDSRIYPFVTAAEVHVSGMMALRSAARGDWGDTWPGRKDASVPHWHAGMGHLALAPDQLRPMHTLGSSSEGSGESLGPTEIWIELLALGFGPHPAPAVASKSNSRWQLDQFPLANFLKQKRVQCGVLHVYTGQKWVSW